MSSNLLGAPATDLEVPANASVAHSHHSIAMDDFSENEETNQEDSGVAEKPLSRFEKSLFALVSG